MDPADIRCLQIEALFQNVLGYPRLPPRVHRFLETHSVSVEQVTATVEALNARYGKELVLYMIRRAPFLIEHTIEEMAENAETIRSMLDLKGCEMFMIVRKNPSVLVLDQNLLRSRFNNLHRITPLGHEDVKAMVRKCPLILNSDTELITRAVDKLRQLSYTRAMWQDNFEVISPSLLAFFLKDKTDLLLRVEYLALTGDSATWSLYNVFKVSNNTFCKKHRGFREWVSKRMARRQQLQQRSHMALQRMRETQYLEGST